MQRQTKRRAGVLLALVVAASPWVLEGFPQGSKTRPGVWADEAFKTQSYTGKVVPLEGVLAKAGVKLDVDATAQWRALVSDDGTIYPLIKDAGARMFFMDPVLLNRPMRLTGRLVPKSQLLQVVNVHSIRKGKLHEVYYWCEICTIRGYERVKCGCCGGPMELREVPVK